jgi:hypothetical protein
MLDIEALAPLVAALLAADAPKRTVLLRPRPKHVPHPCRKLPRLRGVVRISSKLSGPWRGEGAS